MSSGWLSSTEVCEMPPMLRMNNITLGTPARAIDTASCSGLFHVGWEADVYSVTAA